MKKWLSDFRYSEVAHHIAMWLFWCVVTAIWALWPFVMCLVGVETRECPGLNSHSAVDNAAINTRLENIP